MRVVQRVVTFAIGLGSIAVGYQCVSGIAQAAGDAAAAPIAPAPAAAPKDAGPDAAPASCTLDSYLATQLTSPSPDAVKKANLALMSTSDRCRDNSGFDGLSSWYGVCGLTDQLYLAIGPDGALIGSVPPTIREDADVYVAVFEPSKPNPVRYGVQITGCDRPATRVLGTPLPQPAPLRHTAYEPQLFSLGHCSADKQVSIQVTIPVTAGAGCQRTTTVTFQTVSVYSFTVGYGAAYFTGDHTVVGVNQGVGGMPSTVYSRTEARGMSDRLLLGWFPLGYAPDVPLLSHQQGQHWVRSILRRGFVSTLIDVSDPLSSLNLEVGLEPVSGLSFFVGGQFCEKQTALGGGLTNGALFTDDAATLPKVDNWTCKDPAFTVGAAATIDLLAKLFHK